MNKLLKTFDLIFFKHLIAKFIYHSIIYSKQKHIYIIKTLQIYIYIIMLIFYFNPFYF